MGYVVGQLQGSYTSGSLFYAYNEPDIGYHEFAIPVTLSPIMQVCIALETNNPNYIDFDYTSGNGSGGTCTVTAGNEFDAINSSSGIMTTGVESSSSQAAFNALTNPVQAVAVQLYTGGSSWTWWPGNPGSLIYYDDTPNNSVIGGWFSNDPPYNGPAAQFQSN